MKAIKHVNVEKGMKINDLIKEFSKFQCNAGW